MKRLTSKRTRLTLAISLSVFLTVLMVLSGIGIYFVVKSDEFQNPTARINPLEFSVDAWDGRSSSGTEFITDLANRGEKTRTIDSAEAFIYFVNQVNKGSSFEGYTIYLNKNINLNGHAVPSMKNFKGTFDGGYYTIMNGYFYEGALFTNTDGATIKNVGLYNCNFKDAALIKTAVNTDIENVFVRLGDISGANSAGLVGKIVSNNGKHTIKNSFVDTKVNNAFFSEVDTKDIVENIISVEYCYFTNANNAYAGNGNVETDSIVNTKVDNFSKWNYAKDYLVGSLWCDYIYAENSDALNFNYPILRNFVKVYLTGSYIESVVTIDGEATEAATLKEAASQAKANETAEVNLIVEKIFVDEEAKIVPNSTFVINATGDATIVRGANNTGSLISSTEEGAKLVIGNNKAKSANSNTITLDGNREYVEKNNLQSAALIATFSKDVEFASNVVLKNNVNNQTAGGAMLIYGNAEEETLELSVSVDNCSSTSNGGGICVIDQKIKLSNGIISNCSSNGAGGGVCVMSSGTAPEVAAQAASFYGAKKEVRPASNNPVVGHYGMEETGVELNNSVIRNCVITCPSNSPYGAGVYADYWASIYNNSIISNNSIRQEVTFTSSTTSVQTIYGGGIYSPELYISDSKVTDNGVYSYFKISTSTANCAYAYGGGIYVENYLSMSNCAVNGNEAVVECTFTQNATVNSARASGGGIYVESTDGSTSIQNSSINNNRVVNGDYAGVSISTSVTMEGGSISNNIAEGYDYSARTSSVWTTPDRAAGWFKSLTATGVTIANNVTKGTWKGKSVGTECLYVSGNASFINCSIVNNSTEDRSVLYASSLELRGSVFAHNYSPNYVIEGYYGLSINYYSDSQGYSYKDTEADTSYIVGNIGGIYHQYGGSEIYNAVFDGNVNTFQYSLRASKLDDTVFRNNTSSKTDIVSVTSAITISNCVFENNTVETLNVLSVSNNTLTLSNCVLKNNSSVLDGGVLKHSGTTSLTLNNCEFIGNSSAGSGGAVYTKAAVTTNNSTFTNNLAIGSGGAIYGASTVTANNSTFTGNTARVDGGAVYATTTFTSGDAIIKSNTAADCGGGVYAANANIVRSQIIGNNCAEVPAFDENDYFDSENSYYGSGYGGALYVSGTLTANGSLIRDNQSYAYYYSNNMYHEPIEIYAGIAHFTRCEIISNGADGTAICATELLFNSCYVKGNGGNFNGVAMSATTLYVNYKYTNSTYVKDENATTTSLISNDGNYVSASAGIRVGTAYIYNALFADSYTQNRGDGGLPEASYVPLSISGSALIENTTFRDNTTPNSGAACHVGGNATFNDCQFINNKVQMYTDEASYYNGNWYSMTSATGGAVYVGGNGEFTDCSFIGNTADEAGGAVYIVGEANFTDCYFKDNQAKTITVTDAWDSQYTYTSMGSGGAVYTTGKSRFTTCTFENNTAGGSGGAVCGSTIDAYFGGCDFRGNTATNGYGGAVYTKTAYINRVMSNDSTNNAWDTSVPKAAFYNNTGKYGGAVYTTGVTNMFNTEFVGNTSTYEGGAIGTSNGVVTAVQGSFLKNICKSGNGGAISAKGNITIQTCSVLSNKSYLDGGGLYSTATITIKEATVANNTSTKGNGGGIYANSVVSGYTYVSGWVPDDNVTTSTVIMNNSAYGEGGGVRATVYFKNVIVTNNTSTNGQGGGVFNRSLANLTDSTISYNTAATGIGAINSPTVNLTNCNILYNSSTNNGSINAGTANITNSVIMGNKATNGANAGINATTINLEDSIVTKNTATGSAGGISGKNITITNSTISSNQATTGAGIYCSGTLVVSGSKIVDNTATSNIGGGIRGTGAVYINYKSENSAYVQDATVDKTYITGNSSTSGAGIYCINAYVFNADISDNVASAAGGGVYATTIEIANTTLKNNTAVGGGGGLYSSDSATVKDTTIDGNRSSNSTGGGMYVVNVAYLTNTAVTNNFASVSGGGVRASTVYYNYKLENGNPVIDTTITQSDDLTNNTANTNNGGAIWANTAYIYNANIKSNSATNGGGALYLADSATISNCAISNNTSSSVGAGVYAVNNLYLSNTDVTYNTAQNSAGGIRAALVYINYKHDGENYVVDNSTTKSIIQHNTSSTSTGGAIYANSAFIYNADIQFNDAVNNGGAIYCTDSATISNCEMSNNTSSATGGALYVLNNAYLSNVDMKLNISQTSGGAVRAASLYINYKLDGGNYVVDSSTTQSRIYDNASTTGNGGAIWADYAYIYNADFSGNKAVNGGCVNANNEAYIFKSQMVHNDATGNGGAIYAGSGTVYVNYVLDNDSYVADTTLDEVKFTNNTVETNAGGAIYAKHLYLCNALFEKNTSVYAGAVSSSEELVAVGCQFIYNFADYAGTTSSKTATLTDCDINNNTSNRNGGGVLATSNITIYNSTITYNVAGATGAGNGGAIYCQEGDVAIYGSNISNNKTATAGGAICAAKGKVFVNYNYDGSTGTINTEYGRSTFNYNEARNAADTNADSGAIKGYGVLIYNADITNNLTRNYGAGVFISQSTMVSIIKNSNISYNECTSIVNADNTPRGGAGVYCHGSLTIDDCIITGNIHATRNGGGVFAGHFAPDAEGYDGTKTLTITNSTITYNIAGNLRFNGTTEEFDTSLTDHGNGGGVFSNIPTTINNSTINSNKAYDGAAVYAASKLTMNDNSKYSSTISYNTSIRDGAVVVYGIGKINYCSFDHNTTNEKGGALSIYTPKSWYSSEQAKVYKSNFNENSVTKAQIGSGEDYSLAYGGAIYIADHAYIDLCNFYKNSASKGGAIYAETLGISDYQSSESLSFTYNTAQFGGAIYAKYLLRTSVSLKMSYNKAEVGGAIYAENLSEYLVGEITNNEATVGAGGAVYIEDADMDTIAIGDAWFSGGNAMWQGGGSVTSEPKLYLENNKSATDGGAIYIENKTDKLWNGVGVVSVTAVNNTARRNGGAIYIANASITYFNNNNFSDNKALNGGAIYIANGDITSSNSIYWENEENWMEIEGAEVNTEITFANNVATENGGAIYMGCYYSNLINMTFLGNTATNGGAIYNTGTLNLNMRGVVMERNTATNGGAVYSKAPVQITSSSFKASSIVNNTATYGGGLYVEGNNVISIKDLAYLSANNLNPQATGAKGADLYASAGTYINYTGDLTETLHTISAYINGIDLNGKVASAKDATNAMVALRHITLENGNRIGVVGSDIKVVKDAYAVVFDPNGGTLTYNTTETTEAITLYTTASSTKLYLDEALTTEVTALTITPPESEGKQYTFLGWTCDGGDTLAKNIFNINIAEGCTYTAEYSEEILSHIYTARATSGGTIKLSTASDAAESIEIETTGEYEIFESGNEITIDGKTIVAIESEGYMFTGWTLIPDHSNGTTEVIANFIASVTINLDGDVAYIGNGNEYIIIYYDGVEVGRCIHSYSNYVTLPKSSLYTFELVAIMSASEINNSYQFYQYKIDGVNQLAKEEDTYSKRNEAVDGYVTLRYALNINLANYSAGSIIRVYTEPTYAHTMKISYSNESLIYGIPENGVQITGIYKTISGGYLIADDATVTIKINASKLDDSKDIYYTGLNYTLAEGKEIVQSETQNPITSEVSSYSDALYYDNAQSSNGVYTYITTAKIETLIISVFEGKEAELTTNLENATELKEKGVNNLTLKAADGAITTITDKTTSLRIYAGEWEIQNYGTANIAELQDFFGSVGVVEKVGDKVIITVA